MRSGELGGSLRSAVPLASLNPDTGSRCPEQEGRVREEERERRSDRTSAGSEVGLL